MTVGLLHQPGIEAWDEFTCLNSLRESSRPSVLILDDRGLDAEADFVNAAAEDDEGGDRMSNGPLRSREVGELRPSQVLTTFGVGSVVDLPNLSVMVMGLEDWPIERLPGDRARSGSWRRSSTILGPQVDALLIAAQSCRSTRTRSNPFDDAAYVGVPVAPFPRWLVCPYCRLLAPLAVGLFELKLDPYRPTRCRYVHGTARKPGKPPTVVPARFLVACKNGHLDDFPWVEFVHRRPDRLPGTSCGSTRSGPSGEAADIEVQCDELRDVPRRMPRRSATTTRRPARLPGAAAPPAGLRRGRLRRAGPADASPMLRGRRTPGSRSCSRPCRSRKRPTSWSNSSTRLGRTGEVRERAGHRQAAAGNAAQGLRRVHRRPTSGRRSRRSGRPAARSDGRRRDRPEDARVGGLHRPRPGPESRGLPAPGGRAARRLTPGTSRRSSWSSGCGRCGP